MKTKRCTNSSCRKVFKVENLACPHCGKEYPRVNPNAGKYAVVLTDAGHCTLWMLYCAIKPYTEIQMRYTKLLLKNTPSLVATNLTYQQAATCVTTIRKRMCGFAKIIPTSRGTRGIFVLPKRAG